VVGVNKKKTAKDLWNLTNCERNGPQFYQYQQN
jgi:hypothetical protein